LKDKVGFEISKSIRIHAERLGCDLVELNVQADYVHLLVKVPPKVSISTLMGTVKGRTALQIFIWKKYLYWLHINKNPRGKPSRLTLDFLVSLESGVFNRNSIPLFFRPKGRGIKPGEIKAKRHLRARISARSAPHHFMTPISFLHKLLQGF
jgi:hypothetical protein